MKEKKKAGGQVPVTDVPKKKRTIPQPLLWLIAACFILYFPTLQFGFTELDDSIFIRELHLYNEDLSNLWTSFKRGVFDATNDTYYRPLFLNSMILNYQISEQEISGYRLVNLLLHVLSTVFVFKLLLKIGVEKLTAFLLALVFAVHPVLSQAVVWIPGRNDTLMSVFVLPFLITAIDYTHSKKLLSLIISTLCLIAAVFTKETALFASASAFVLLVIVLKNNWKEKTLLVQYVVWFATIGIYFVARSTATLKQQMLVPSQMLDDFAHRLPLLIQYLGKIFLPFNLSVFPIQQDTSYYFGIAALVILAALLFFASNKNTRLIIGGVLFFIVFLIPVLFVPNNLNEQTFEHRLYLPIIGILLVLSQSVIFKNKLAGAKKLYIVTSIVVLYAFINYRHQQNFKDPLSFWSQASNTSPHSAYALMMYGARVEDKQQGYALMRRAYQLNPNEKYLNYYYGVMLQNQDSVLASEKYFLKEQEISDYFECDFYLAQVDYQKDNKDGAQKHLERYLTRDSMNSAANNNLLLLYLGTNKKDKALNHISNMQRRGLTVPPNLIQQAQLLQ
ncbi:MAG TPA: hypothetical protein PL009_09920 [Flavipsychrobacter sp.]|nr:hypothetical protein [Flavipsychrobacter sp.]